MKLTRSRTGTLISDLARQTLEEDYPQLSKPRIYAGFGARSFQRLPKSIRVAALLFLSGLLVNEFLANRALIISTYHLDPVAASDILSASLEYLAGLIGIVLPVVLIIVQFLSRDASALVDVYLDKTGIKTTAFIGLFVLGFEAGFMAVVRSSIIKDPRFLIYIIFAFMLLNLTVIFETGRTIWNLRSSLSASFVRNAWLTKLTADVRESQKTGVEYRLLRLTHLRECESLHLRRNVGFQPRNSIPLRASRSGVIQDVVLEPLILFATALHTPLDTASDTMGYVTKLVKDPVSESEVIAYVSASEMARVEELRDLLEQSFRYGPSEKREERIEDTTAQLRQLTARAITTENQILFEDVVQVYGRLFELGRELPVPPSTEWIGHLFPGWPVTRRAIWDLRDLVELASRTAANRQYISLLAHEISSIAGSMIAGISSAIEESLKDLLGLFVTMYRFAYRHNNEIGIDRSYYYLTKDLVDRVWIGSVANAGLEPALIQRQHRALAIILQTLSAILHAAFLNHDLDTVRTLLSRMQSDELLAYLHHISTSALQRHEVLSSLEHATGDERNVLASRLQALDLIERLPQMVDQYNTELVFVASGYLLELYERKAIGEKDFVKLRSVVSEYHPNFAQLLHAFLRLVQAGPTIDSFLFTRFPDTKHAYWSSDDHKYYLFYCLRGIELSATGKIADSDLAMDLQPWLDQIRQVVSAIEQNAERWAKVLDLSSEVIRENVQVFTHLNLTITERSKNMRDTQIIKSPLSLSRIDVFREAIDKAIENTGRSQMRGLLSRFGALEKNGTFALEGASYWGHRERAVYKEHFTEHSRDSLFVEHLGAMFGNWLTHAETREVIRFWTSRAKTIPTRKEWMSLKPYFDRAIEGLKAGKFKPSCFLLPRTHTLLEPLRRTPGFVERYLVDHEEWPMLRGFYETTPVLEYGGNASDPQYLIAVDLGQAFRLVLEPVTVEVRELTSQERDQVLARNEEAKERELLLSVIMCVLERVKPEILNRNALLKLRLKFPNLRE